MNRDNYGNRHRRTRYVDYFLWFTFVFFMSWGIAAHLYFYENPVMDKGPVYKKSYHRFTFKHMFDRPSTTGKIVEQKIVEQKIVLCCYFRQHFHEAECAKNGGCIIGSALPGSFKFSSPCFTLFTHIVSLRRCSSKSNLF